MSENIPYYNSAKAFTHSRGWETLFFFSEAVMIVFYCVGTTFTVNGHSWSTDAKDIALQQATANEKIIQFYPMWQDVHVIMFIGYAYLMAFLKTHCFASIGFTFLITAWLVQCVMVFQGFWQKVLLEKSVSKINIDMPMLINGDFGASACLISMGAVLGKVSFPQLFVLATIESIFYTLNITLTLDYLGAEDAGGSITIHMFGAYFGIVASYFFKPQRGIEDKFKQGKSDYWSNLFTMVGTIIIFVYCPSFNAIFRDGQARHRSIVNTFLSLTSSTLFAVAMSRVYLRKIDMEILLNATLAGGVVMGTACDDITNPGFAMLVGAISGVISSFGFLKMNDWLKKKINLHDTCGITFLHALPGTLGGFVSVICAASMNYNFGSKLQQELVAPRIQTRSVSEQAGFQLAAMGITTCISISSAILASFVASRLPHPEIIFDDAVHFDKVHYGDGIAKFNLENKVAGAAESIAQKTH